MLVDSFGGFGYWLFWILAGVCGCLVLVVAVGLCGLLLEMLLLVDFWVVLLVGCCGWTFAFDC